jgi:hydrogenase expression/formation protein HypC
MCLAIPGKVVSIEEATGAVGGQIATVDFHGSRVEVSLAMVPDAVLGSWVLVHAGYAIEVLDEEEAAKTWDWLRQADLVEEIPSDLEDHVKNSGVVSDSAADGSDSVADCSDSAADGSDSAADGSNSASNGKEASNG